MAEELKAAGLGHIKFADFKVQAVLSVPAQDNGFDCGVFVMKFMESKFNREAHPAKVQCFISYVN